MTTPQIALEENFLKLLKEEYPLRRPENSYRIFKGLIDIRNYFVPDRHERLNESASFILELCDGSNSIYDIWKALLEGFEVDDHVEALCATVRLIRYFQRNYILYFCTIKREQNVDPVLNI